MTEDIRHPSTDTQDGDSAGFYDSSMHPSFPRPAFESTINIGDYKMPRAGKTDDYMVKGKDKYVK